MAVWAEFDSMMSQHYRFPWIWDGVHDERDLRMWAEAQGLDWEMFKGQPNVRQWLQELEETSEPVESDPRVESS